MFGLPQLIFCADQRAYSKSQRERSCNYKAYCLPASRWPAGSTTGQDRLADGPSHVLVNRACWGDPVSAEQNLSPPCASARGDRTGTNTPYTSVHNTISAMSFLGSGPLGIPSALKPNGASIEGDKIPCHACSTANEPDKLEINTRRRACPRGDRPGLIISWDSVPKQCADELISCCSRPGCMYGDDSYVDALLSRVDTDSNDLCPRALVDPWRSGAKSVRTRRLLPRRVSLGTD
ncbi:hypothetical protein VTK26DRAFT_6588 [Humicola hyalothermophila]